MVCVCKQDRDCRRQQKNNDRQSKWPQAISQFAPRQAIRPFTSPEQKLRQGYQNANRQGNLGNAEGIVADYRLLLQVVGKRQGQERYSKGQAVPAPPGKEPQKGEGEQRIKGEKPALAEGLSTHHIGQGPQPEKPGPNKSAMPETVNA